MNYIDGLVSVIIPTHNRYDFIGETIDSVVNQSYKLLELILVDDHSEAEYVCFIETLISHINTEIDVKLVKNGGVGACAARNTGIQYSQGQYIQFFDDDDIMLPYHIECKVKSIREGKLDYVSCNYTFFDTNKPAFDIEKKNISSIEHNAAVHILRKAFPTPCFMCTRETIGRIGYWNEKIKKLQDFSYFHRLYLFDCKGTYMDSVLFRVRVHGNSMTQRTINAAEGQIYTLESIQNVKKEWKSVGGDKWDAVKLPIVFMEFTTGRNLCMMGYKCKGMMLLIKLAFLNPVEIFCLIAKAFKNKTLHLTDVLVKDYA